MAIVKRYYSESFIWEEPSTDTSRIIKMSNMNAVYSYILHIEDTLFGLTLSECDVKPNHFSLIKIIIILKIIRKLQLMIIYNW